MYAYIYIYIYIYVYIYIYIYIICIYNMYNVLYAYTFCAYDFLSLCVCVFKAQSYTNSVWMYICMQAGIYMHTQKHNIYIHIHIHIYIHTNTYIETFIYRVSQGLPQDRGPSCFQHTHIKHLNTHIFRHLYTHILKRLYIRFHKVYPKTEGRVVFSDVSTPLTIEYYCKCLY